MADNIGSVGVEVVPDATGFVEKLKAKLNNISVDVQAKADTGEANAELDKTARTRTARVKVDVDKNPLEQGAASLDKFTRNLGLLPALAIAGSAALVPLAGALGGVVAALAAPLAIAGGGATLFAVLAGFAVKDTEKQLKSIDSLQTKLDGLTKGTAEYAQAQKDLADARKSLSPSQVAFSNAQGGLAASFQDFIGGRAGTALLGPLTQGMRLLSHILPPLTPVLVAAGGAFSTLLGGIDRAASGPGFDRFIHMVSGQVGHDIVGFGHAAGDIAKGLGGLFVQLDKSVGSSMVDTLERLSHSFADWSNSRAGRRDVREFLDYFHQVGPQVGDTIGAVARALGKVVDALAPLGPPVLKGIETASNAIASIPTPVLTGLAAAFVGMTAFGKVGGFKGVGSLSRALTGGRGGLVGSALASAGVVPVFVTNPGFGGGTGGLPGTGVPGTGTTTGKGGFLGKAGTLTMGALGIGAADQFLSTVLPKEYGDTVGNSVAAAIRGAFSLPDPKLASAGPHLFSGASDFLFNRDSHAKPMSLPPQPFEPRVQLPNATALDALTAKAARASRTVDLIGPNASASMRAAIRAVANFNNNPASFDGTRTKASAASRSLDLIGHSAARNSAQAVGAINGVQRALSGIHSKDVKITANTGSAIASLERLQAMTIRDKSFNVIQNNIERNVGPGGGIQRHATGGWVTGPGTSTSDSVVMRASAGEYVVNAHAAAQNRALLDQINSGRNAAYTPGSAARGGGVIHTRVYLDGQEIGRAMTPYMDDHAEANAQYARTRHEASL